MPGTNHANLTFELQGILAESRAAVLVKDPEGFCLLANSVAEELLQYPAGGLSDLHMLDLGQADPRLIEGEFERLKREGFWAGRYPVRRHDGSMVFVTAVALACEGGDGSPLYAEFLYPLTRRAQQVRVTPAAVGLTARDLCLLQLSVDGLTRHQLAYLFQTDLDSLAAMERDVVLKMQASSKTEAAVRAIKAHLVV